MVARLHLPLRSILSKFPWCLFKRTRRHAFARQIIQSYEPGQCIRQNANLIIHNCEKEKERENETDREQEDERERDRVRETLDSHIPRES